MNGMVVYKEEIMAVKVLVFSPTGGTDKVAGILANAISTDWEKVDLSTQNFDGGEVEISATDKVIIAMPDFGGRAPAVAIKHLKKIKGNGAQCVTVCVYGNRAFEDGLIEMADAAEAAGFSVVAGIAAVAEHSIMHQYATDRPDADDKSTLEKLGRIFAELPTSARSALSTIPGNRPYKKAGSVPLVPKVGSTCAKCGECASSCPAGAIDPVTFKADKDICISCMRCIKVCPVDARNISSFMVKTASKMIAKEESTRKEAQLFI